MRTRERILSATLVLRATPNALLGVLDWFLNLAERLIALGICAMIFYLGFRFVSGAASESDSKLFALAASNWKVLLLILIPLFFPTVKKLFLEAKEIGWYKRQLPGLPDIDEKRE